MHACMDPHEVHAGAECVAATAGVLPSDLVVRRQRLAHALVLYVGEGRAEVAIGGVRAEPRGARDLVGVLLAALWRATAGRAANEGWRVGGGVRQAGLRLSGPVTATGRSEDR